MKYLAYIGAENGSTAFSGTVNRERQSVFFEWGIGVICSYFFTGHLSTLQPLSGSFPSDFFPFVLHLYSFWSHSSGLQDLTGVRSSFMFGWISDCNVLTPGWSCVFHFIFPLNLLMLISHFLIVLHLKNFRSYCFWPSFSLIPCSASKKPFHLVSKFPSPSFEINSLDHGFVL